MRQNDGDTPPPKNFGALDPWDNRAERFVHPLHFPDEDHAKAYLRDLIRPHFVFLPEVMIRVGDNLLRIDYLAQPRQHTEFPFKIFGIEVKRGFKHGHEYTTALKQCADYTQATIVDKRTTVFNGHPVERVYLFPGMPDDWPNDHPTMYWVSRLIGKFHVGLIYRERHQGLYFTMCADRQWSERHGPIRRKHNVRHLLGSGVPRK